MNESTYERELAKCVKCGACKTLCPTYSATLDETMGARGRIALLGALIENELTPSRRLADKIFSCVLCEACKDLCPTGIDIPETIYAGRTKLRTHFRSGRLLAVTLKYSMSRMDTTFFILRALQKFLYPFLYNTGRLRHIPEISSSPFKNIKRVYKRSKNVGRVAIFAGCSVNYLYPHLGKSLLQVLLTRGYEVVVMKGEMCCGAPMRSLGLENEAATLARKNIDLFNKMNAEAILCICPTCTMTIRNQYPLLTGETIAKIMDINEFLLQHRLLGDLKSPGRVVVYHDPCHLRYGLGIKDEPREILGNIEGLKLMEMRNAGECCGFGGFFSQSFKDLSMTMGERKLEDARETGADTLVTSCPGCVMQFEDIRDKTGGRTKIMHIIELIDEALR